MKLIKIVLICSMLGACVGTPLSSIWKLRNFNPLEADPRQVRLAVITNEIVSLSDKSTSLTLGFKSKIPGYSFSDTFYASLSNNANVIELEQHKATHEHITLFYLDDDAAHRMRVAQNRIKSIKEQEIEGEGSLSVNIDTGCFNGPKPEHLIASIFARFNAENGYIKLSSGVDLLAEAEKSEELLWVECSDENNAEASL